MDYISVQSFSYTQLEKCDAIFNGSFQEVESRTSIWNWQTVNLNEKIAQYQFMSSPKQQAMSR